MKIAKEKIRLLIPLGIVAILLIYCWTNFLISDAVPTWEHYIGLDVFCTLVFLFFARFNHAMIGTGIFLVLGTFKLLAITPEINTHWIRIGPVSTPPIQLLPLGLFIFYFWINFDSLVDIHLDYRENKQSSKNRQVLKK